MSQLTPFENIQNSIFTIRGMQVMIDQELAGVYNAENKTLNRAG